MTALMDRARPKGGGASLLGTTLPQVNLLPPEIRARRGLSLLKRWLGVSLLLVLALCAVGFAGSLVISARATSDLTAAEQETTRLQAEQHQYAEVPTVLSALASVTSARTLGMSTEVQWKSYLDAITAVLPAGVSIDTIAVNGATPMSAGAPAADPLQSSSVGQILFTGRTLTIPDTSAWMDALSTIPGFSDVWVSSSAVAGDSGNTFYNVSVSIQFTDAAYSQRFAATEGTK